MKRKLMYGDCLERMKDIPDNSIDMVLTDPPYGTTACKWDTVIPFEPMWEQLKRITKDDGAICLFGSEPFSSALRMSNIKMFRYDWVWRKNKPSNYFNARRQPLKNVELISVFYKNQCKYYPQGVTPSGVTLANTGTKSKRKQDKKDASFNGGLLKKEYTQHGKGYPRQILNGYKNGLSDSLHPTQKPVALLEYLIKTYTLEGETVLDFTMGSGSTGVAAKNLGRKFIGIEKDEKYFKIAKQRIKDCCQGIFTFVINASA